MQDRSSISSTDWNEPAKRLDDVGDGERTGPTPPKNLHGKNPAAVALGRQGGLKGGKARAASMTPEQRSEAARKAAQARWATE